MTNDRDFPDFPGLILGAARVGDLDIAYAEFPAGTESRATRLHWFLSVGDEGVVDAQVVSEGPLVPGIPFATQEQILRWISVRTPSKDWNFGKAATQGFVRNSVDDVELDDLIELMCSHSRSALDRRERMQEVASLRKARFEGVRERLGLRLLLARNRPPAGRAAAIRMSAASVRAFEAFVEARPWLVSVAPLSDLVDLCGDPIRDQDELLGSLDVIRAASRRIGPYAGRIYLETLALVRSVPIDWVPGIDDAAGWAAFTAIAESLGGLTGSQEWYARALVAPSKGKWPDFARSVSREIGFDGDRFLAARIARNARDLLGEPGDGDPIEGALLDVTVDCNNMLSAFQNALMMARPVEDEREFERFHETVGKLTWKALAQGRGMRELIAVSRRWHRDRGRGPLPKSATPLIEWEPILPSWLDEATGIAVAPLTNSHALLDEGSVGPDDRGVAGLDHCVGDFGFVRDSALGVVRILSLRKDGRRLSTAELATGNGGSMRQHRGKGNGTPSPEAERTLAAYMALPEVAALLEAPFPGFDPRNLMPRPSPEDALTAWKPYLTAPFRNAAPAEILALLDETLLRLPAA